MNKNLCKAKFLYHAVWNNLNRDQKKSFFLILFLTVISALMDGLSIGLIIPFLSILLDPKLLIDNTYFKNFSELFNFSDYENLTLYITSLFLSTVILSTALKACLIIYNLRLGQNICHSFSSKLYLNNLYANYEQSLKQHSSDVISLVKNKSLVLSNTFFLQINQIFSSLIILTTIISLLLFINVTIAMTTFLTFGSIYLIITFVARKKMNQYSKMLGVLDPKSIKLLNEGIGAKKDIILNSAQKYYIALYKKIDFLNRRVAANVQILAALPRVFIEALALCILAMFAFILSSLSSSFISIIPIIGAFVLAAQKLLPQLQLMYASWVLICSALESVDDVINELHNKNIPVRNFISYKIPFQNKIIFEKIIYSYTNKDNLILKNFNLKISKGDIIGLIGQTGSGKSTFLDLLMGFLEPTSGSIIIDNKKLTKKNVSGWQSHISHVPQTIFLADESVLENIAIGVNEKQINKNLVIQSAKRAQIHNDIIKWKDGYDTIIGENGVKLSGGQRQRIGLARCFYKEKPMIILDEATSALDFKTEKKIISEVVALVKEKKLTMIICSHRKEALNKCNYFINIENGKLSKLTNI